MSGKVTVSEVKITSFSQNLYGGSVIFSVKASNIAFDYVYKFSANAIEQAIANGAMHMKHELDQLSSLTEKVPSSPGCQAISKSVG